MLTEQDRDGLDDLRNDTEEFVNKVFDWVAPLQQHDLLSKLYDLQAAIKTELERLEKNETSDAG